MKPELEKFIRESNLDEEDKLTINFLAESIEKNEVGEFNDRLFLFGGDPGIGKTYFVENFIKQLGLPIIFLGPFKMEHKNVIQVEDMGELTKELLKTEECIVFIDDLQNSFQMERDGMGEWLSDTERKRFLKMLEHIRRADKKKFLFITLNDEDTLEEPWLDRIENRMNLEEPSEKTKKIFLKNKYSKYLNKSLINEISQKSIGYNFRNLDEIIKASFRHGKGKITKAGIKKALSEYTPTSLERFEVIHKTDVKFKDIIGNERIKKELAYLMSYIKHPKFFSKSGIERSNVIIFNGPPGTGKTFMAKALAGELDLPLINIDAINIHGRNPLVGVRIITDMARRFKNCIVFVDEMDKLLGQEMMSEEREAMGSLESEIDGMREKTKAIIILTMNNKSRFGNAFHDRVPCFNFEPPTESERRAFIEKKISRVQIPVSPKSLNLLVNVTNGKSYRHIERIWNNVLFKVMENPESALKNNKLIAKAEHIESTINEVTGYVSKTGPPTTMYG